LLSDCAGSAAPAPALLAATVDAVARIAAGQPLTATVSATVAALTKGVATSASLSNGKIMIAFLLIAGVFATGAGLGAYDDPARPPADAQQSAALVRPHELREQLRQDQEAAVVRRADALGGHWQLTLPAGFQYHAVIKPLGADRLSVEKAVRFSGVYELRDNRLVLVEPINRGPLGFEWEVRGSDELLLVGQPPIGKTGANYLGATLRRLPH
jgi:hypothetical protein